VGGLRRDRGCPAAREPQIGSGADEEPGDRHVPGDDRTKSLFHLHRDSDEVAWVLAGEFTFKIGDEVTVGGPGTCAFMPRDVPHAWKNTGGETGRVLFLYTPAGAGGYIEALSEHRPTDADERNKLLQRHRWEVVGPNPL